MDVRLITLIPPTPPVAQSTGAQATTTQGTLIVPQFPAGSVLAGFIINRDPTGNPILRTEHGDFVFSSNFFLKIGSEVVLRIQNSGGQPNAHIVSVNGQPPEIAVTQSAFIDAPEVIVGQKQSTTPQPHAETTQQHSQTQSPTATTYLPTPRPGQSIAATLITPAFIPSAPQRSTPGTRFLLVILGAGAQTSALPSSPTPLSQLTPTTIPAAKTDALSSLLPETSPAIITPPTSSTTQPPSTSAPLVATNPSGQSLPFSASNAQAATTQFAAPLGQTITATVITQHPDGSTTLATPLGTLRATDMGASPAGQPFTVRVTSVGSPNHTSIALANATPAASPAPLTELSRTWTSLQHIVQILGDDIASQIIPTFPMATNFTPDIPSRITQSASRILFFIAALKGGNFRDWLGSANVKSLEEKGYKSLLHKAEGEFMSLAKQFVEPHPGNWQSLFFPVMAGGELQQLRSFIKREKKKNAEGEATGDEDTRFVVEMELSHLGEMQMDGLVKRRDERLQFDLIIRSHEPLPISLQKDIESIFTGTAEVTGYRGQITFQTVYNFPLHPIEDTTPHVFNDLLA